MKREVSMIAIRGWQSAFHSVRDDYLREERHAASGGEHSFESGRRQVSECIMSNPMVIGTILRLNHVIATTDIYSAYTNIHASPTNTTIYANRTYDMIQR